MNKSELIAQVAKSAVLTHDQAGKAIDAIMAAIQSALAAGDQVTLVGFGSFSVADRAAKTGRNPRTGEPLHIAASRIPHFKPGQTLKTAVALKADEPSVAKTVDVSVAAKTEVPKTPMVAEAKTSKAPVAAKVAAPVAKPVEVPKAPVSAKPAAAPKASAAKASAPTSKATTQKK